MVEKGKSGPVLSWSGGKDSALALHALRKQGREPSALLTTVTEEYERISMHGVRRVLLRTQAERAGLPLLEVNIPPNCTNELYQERLGAMVHDLLSRGHDHFAFGDLFLEDIRAYREEQLRPVGAQAIFPLWGADTPSLSRKFIDLGFRAVVVTVDPRQLDASFCGREYDQAFLNDLPESVDPMGENGEFHTFVYDGPIYSSQVHIRRGEVVERDGFIFCDLFPPANRP